MELSRPRTMLSFENPQFLPNNYETKGGFPMEIKTEIRYVIMCCYLNFTLQILITTNYKLSYFCFNFHRKSTLCSTLYNVNTKQMCGQNVSWINGLPTHTGENSVELSKALLIKPCTS